MSSVVPKYNSDMQKVYSISLQQLTSRKRITTHFSNSVPELCVVCKQAIQCILKLSALQYHTIYYMYTNYLERIPKCTSNCEKCQKYLVDLKQYLELF